VTSKPVLVAVTSKRDEHQTAVSPTYSEVSGRDALEEQLDRSPGNISELLDGVSGVRVQPLSAGSAGVGIRIRGMPARYTKILMDGLPLQGATPEGQLPLQISALDLERVEVVPGVTSALYGPTSLSGSINMISAGPTAPSQIVLNGSSLEASDIAVFQTQTFSPQWAATLTAGRHYANPADPDGDGWAEVDGYKRLVVRPRVYWTRSATSSWFMTGGWTTENRRGGTFADKRLPDFNRYSDDADTRRGEAGTVGRIQLDTSMLLTVRASMTREWRTRWYGDNQERDRRNEIFGDVSLTKTLRENQTLVGGLSLDRDQYAALDTRNNDYRYTTPAVYGEYTWTPDPRYGVTANAHLDLQSQYGDFVSPRVSVFARPSAAWLLRLSRANGVYAPTPITDETEAYGLGAVRWQVNEAEHALGWAFDVDHLSGALDLHASAYHTVVSNPLIVRIPPGSSQGLEIRNADESARTQGVDVSMQYRARALRFTANYSYINAIHPEIGFIIGDGFVDDTTMSRPVPYTPAHSAYFDAAYEKENDRVIGVDVRFAGSQVLADSTVGASQPWVTVDARLEKHIKRAILFVRGKNLMNVHQLQYAPVLRASSGPAGQWADNVWAPLEGISVNAGLRIRY
jgi:outer membrane receptor for ferrienterochelin and colicins